MSKQFQWFPGHISKSLKELNSLKSSIDLFVIVLDSRAPKSSFLDSMDEISSDSKRLYVFNKVDLSIKEKIDFFIKKNKIENYLLIDKFDKNKVLKFKDAFDNIFSNKIGFKRIALIGVPNVGKSTILNNLKNNKSANTMSQPGTTRELTFFKIFDKYLLLDSPGILEPKFYNQDIAKKLVLIGSIKKEVIPLEEELSFILQQKEQWTLSKEINEIISKISKEPIDNNELNRLINNMQKGKLGKFFLD